MREKIVQGTRNMPTLKHANGRDRVSGDDLYDAMAHHHPDSRLIIDREDEDGNWNSRTWYDSMGTEIGHTDYEEGMRFYYLPRK